MQGALLSRLSQFLDRLHILPLLTCWGVLEFGKGVKRPQKENNEDKIRNAAKTNRVFAS